MAYDINDKLSHKILLWLNLNHYL